MAGPDLGEWLAKPSAGRYTSKSPANVPLKAFPGLGILTSHIPFYVVELNPGDVLFVPACWWHQVEAFSTNTDKISCAFNYFYERPSKEVYNELDMKKIKMASTIEMLKSKNEKSEMPASNLAQFVDKLKLVNRTPRSHNAPESEKAGLLNSGLANHGNTCYMNSVLQCLYHCTFFKAFFLENEPSFLRQKRLSTLQSAKNNRKPTPIERQQEVYYGLEDLIRWLSDKDADPRDQENHKCDSTKHILTNIRLCTENKCFEEGQQHDPHEFLTYLFDSLSESCFKEEEDPLTSTFEGAIERSRVCEACAYTYSKTEKFYILQIPLDEQNQKKIHIQELITCLFEKAIVEDYKCPNCKHITKAEEKESLVNDPAHLCIQLKRFMSHNGEQEKIKTSIQLSPEIEIQLKDGRHLKYQIKGTIQHIGEELTSGHFVSTCCDNNGKWKIFDDNYVSACGFPGQNPYILFYEKKHQEESFFCRNMLSSENQREDRCKLQNAMEVFSDQNKPINDASKDSRQNESEDFPLTILEICQNPKNTIDENDNFPINSETIYVERITNENTQKTLTESWYDSIKKDLEKNLPKDLLAPVIQEIAEMVQKYNSELREEVKNLLANLDANMKIKKKQKEKKTALNKASMLSTLRISQKLASILSVNTDHQKRIEALENENVFLRECLKKNMQISTTASHGSTIHAGGINQQENDSKTTRTDSKRTESQMTFGVTSKCLKGKRRYTEEESAAVSAGVREFGTGCWARIQKSTPILQTRTREDIKRHWKKISKKMSSEELTQVKHGQVKPTKFTEDEENAIAQGVNKYKTKWVKIRYCDDYKHIFHPARQPRDLKAKWQKMLSKSKKKANDIVFEEEVSSEGSSFGSSCDDEKREQRE